MYVSVICPVFNTSPDFLLMAARSVLAQTGAELELILIDDKSTDSTTIDALEGLRKDDGRVVVIHLDCNQGPSLARAAGLAAARGSWIGFVDADDAWRPGTLQRIAELAGRHPEAAWLCGNHSIWTADGTEESPRLSLACPGERLGQGLFLAKSPDLTRTLITNTWLHLGSCFVRADLARQASVFLLGLSYGEDWLFFLVLSTKAPLFYIEASTYLLRRQHESLTTDVRRHSMARAAGHKAAMAEARLRPFRRELRWALYSAYKGIAANNLLAGRQAQAAAFAVRAFFLDPRSVRDMLGFIRLLRTSDPQALRAAIPSYSRAELYRSHAERHGRPA